MPNVDPLKLKIMKLTYTWEVAFNIIGTTLHFALAIPLNKNYNEPKTLNDVKQMVTIDEISLVYLYNKLGRSSFSIRPFRRSSRRASVPPSI
jgi:hypothetical protein